LRIERALTKDQILELYINRIYFGSGCYGVETASQSYFGKSAARLDLSEAALLAGLIRSPNRFSPLKNPEGATVQRDTVLDRMLELKKISAAQVREAKMTKVTSRPRRLPLIQENYAMDAVQRDLNLLLTQDQIDNGGLFIYTTLDPVVQNAAAEAIEKQLTKIEREPGFRHPLKANYQPPVEGEDNSMPYLEGALVAIDNNSGGIRALVGGPPVPGQGRRRTVRHEVALMLNQPTVGEREFDEPRPYQRPERDRVDSGLLAYLPDRRLGQRLAVLDAAADREPPAAGVRVARVHAAHQQQPVGRIEQQYPRGEPLDDRPTGPRPASTVEPRQFRGHRSSIAVTP
jgi:hypothetical protein